MVGLLPENTKRREWQVGTSLDISGVKSPAAIGNVPGWNLALEDSEYVGVNLLKILDEDKFVCQESFRILICRRQELPKRRIRSGGRGTFHMKWNPPGLTIHC